MERQVCTHCGITQPRDFAAGQLCVACGQAVRLERACPWCLVYSPAGRFCKSCGCELPEPQFFGAARMLKDAGVDRFSLGSRLREMDPELVAVLQRRYEEQRVVVLRRVEEARLCQRFLRQQTFADALEEELLGRLPMNEASLAGLGAGPQAPFDDEKRLPEIFRQSPLGPNRDLAAIALVRLGKEDREVLRWVAGLFHQDSPVGLDAALALSHWRFLHLPGNFPGRDQDLKVLSERAERGLGNPALRVDAAVAAAILPFEMLHNPWWGGSPEEARERLEKLTPFLQEGLDSPDPGLRFSCALLLEDEPRLLRSLDDPDELVRTAARLSLTRRGLAVERMVADLAAAPEEERLSWFEKLPTPLPVKTLELLLGEAAKGSGEFCKRAMRLVRREKHWMHDEASRTCLGQWIRRLGPEKLSLDELLDGLEWASRDPAEGSAYPPPAPRYDGAVRDWLSAVTEALSRLSPKESAEGSGGAGFTRWLWAATDPPSQGVLDSWAADPEAGKVLFERMCSLESYAERLVPSGLVKGWELMIGIWDRAMPAVRAAVARSIAAGWSWAYAQDEKGPLVAFSERYRARPDQRLFIRVASAGLLSRDGRNWNDLHAELLPGVPPGGEDPLRTFEELCELRPGSLYENVQLVLDGIDVSKAADVARALFAKLQVRQEEATQLLPPAVAYGRWLDEVARTPGNLEPLAEAIAVFEDSWGKLIAGVVAPGDETASYYVKEKREEIAEILGRVK